MCSFMNDDLKIELNRLAELCVRHAAAHDYNRGANAGLPEQSPLADPRNP
jgi:hypothetical protein